MVSFEYLCPRRRNILSSLVISIVYVLAVGLAPDKSGEGGEWDGGLSQEDTFFDAEHDARGRGTVLLSVPCSGARGG
jgi:hypothetical protein